MKYTNNKGLKLPEYTDVIDIEDINENFEVVDEHFGELIASDAGVHGFRYNAQDETFEIQNANGEWEEVSSAGGGGGIALGTVTNIATLTASGKVYIKWTDPDNIEADGIVLAEWAGTVLVRKAGSAPAGRKDGTIVIDSQTKNAYSANYFCDSGLTDGATYYYKFFPYTTAKLYTDSAENAFSATPNPVCVGNVSNISVTSGSEILKIKWTDPDATVAYDGITVATWASTKVVYRTDRYPETAEDGVLALNSTTRNAYSSSTYTISGLTNDTTYYISLFPVTTDGAVTVDDANRIAGTPRLVRIENVPSQNGILTYTGSEQSPAWSNYNTSLMSIGGVTVGTNAGTYNATFTPRAGYCWSDGSTSAKTVAWTIGKANGSISLSKSSITLNSSTLTDTVTVTRSGGGTITVASDNTDVATVSLSGSTITISHVNKTTGVANITVSVGEDSNYHAPNDATIVVAAVFVSATLNDNDWATISEVSADGTGANYWSVGDCKSINVNGTVGTLTVDSTCWVYILSFSHNTAREGSGIHFGGFKTAQTGGTDVCLCDSIYNSYSTSGTKYFNMNHSSNTNSGGWKGCDLRYDVLGSTDTDSGNASANTATSPVSGTLMAALPSDLRAVMKPMTKYTDNTGGGSDTASYVTATTDYLPLLSEFEIQGTRSYANSAEKNYQEQYAYYASGNSKVKYKHNGTSTAAIWWLRSPYYNGGSTFCGVGAGGGAYGINARDSRGLAPAFKI